MNKNEFFEAVKNGVLENLKKTDDTLEATINKVTKINNVIYTGLPVPPEMKTVSPAFGCISSNACSAVSAVSGTQAASSSERYSGTFAIAEASIAASPSWMPDILLRADGYETNFYKKD